MDISTLGERSCGVWTRQQALQVLSPARIAHLVAVGAWQVTWAGVYADGGYALDAEQRAFAATLACGGAGQLVAPRPSGTRLVAVACGRTAARVWGLPLVDDTDPATGAQEHLVDDVAVFTSAKQQRQATRRLVPRQLTLERADVVRRTSGLWITSPLRTLVDGARLLTHESLVCALDDALHRELVTAQELADAVRGRRGLAGVPALRRAVALADGRAESPAETLARLLLLPVLPHLVPQVRLLDARGRIVARVDLGDEEVQLAVEADGTRGHAGAQMVAKDRRRDRRTDVLGWRTERVTWSELRREQAGTRGRIVAAHAAQAARRPT